MSSSSSTAMAWTWQCTWLCSDCCSEPPPSWTVWSVGIAALLLLLAFGFGLLVGIGLMTIEKIGNAIQNSPSTVSETRSQANSADEPSSEPVPTPSGATGREASTTPTPESTTPTPERNWDDYCKIWLTLGLQDNQEVTVYHSGRCARILSENSIDSLETLTPCKCCITFEETRHVLDNEMLYKAPTGKRYHQRHCRHIHNPRTRPMTPCEHCFGWSMFSEGVTSIYQH